MKVRLPLLDKTQKTILKKEIDVKPIAYRLSHFAYWKLLIADENKDVEKGKANLVKVQKFTLPPNTTISPLSVTRNALGIVLDVCGSVPEISIEKEREIEYAIFLPTENGRIEKGDMLGVVNVFLVGTAPMEMKLKKIDLPDAKLDLKEYEANVVYNEDGKIKRTKVSLKELSYRMGLMAEFIPIISNENREVKKGEVVKVDIKAIRLQPFTIPERLSILRSPFGFVADITHDGKPKKIEETRILNKAIFVPIADGEIKENDLIGILSNYNISIEGLPPEISLYEAHKINLVYKKNGEVKRKVIELKPFGYKRSDRGIFEPIIANEDLEFKANEIVEVKIDEINLPAGTIAHPLFNRSNAFGFVIDIVSEKHKLIEEDKEIISALFYTITDGRIEKGDLLGVLDTFHAGVISREQMISFRIF